MDPLVGQLIANRYRSGALLGRGGMCSVYRAENTVKARSVAVKVLPAHKARIDELARRFQREITTAKRIDHPHVATISDSGALADGSLFLVMELLEGTLLTNVLDQGRLPIPRALGIARQMLTGLGEAHRIGVVHRDVKPDNVMLVDVDGVETVKLFDFGIASNVKAAVKLTAAGTAFGTPEYISPEMARGDKVDARAALYAVGVVLFEMVAGRRPFVGDDGISLLRAHINERAPSPRAVAPDANLPPALDRLILRALEKNPADRFFTTEEMVAAIDGVLRPKTRRRTYAVAAVFLALAAAALVAKLQFHLF